MNSPLAFPALLPSLSDPDRLAAFRPFAALREILIPASFPLPAIALAKEGPGSPPSSSLNSFVALLLQPTLHNFGALATITYFDGITYRRSGQKSRKSNAALLLPHVFAVSPLLRCSYKKMGAGGHTALVRSEGALKSQCFLSLATIHQNAPKIAQCFLSLTGHASRKYQSFLSLKKKGGWGVFARCRPGRSLTD
jgi:hypothetical protein